MARNVKNTATNVDICPSCGSEKLETYDSRNYSGCRRRHRRCVECGETISTVEICTSEYLAMIDLVKASESCLNSLAKIRESSNGQ